MRNQATKLSKRKQDTISFLINALLPGVCWWVFIIEVNWRPCWPGSGVATCEEGAPSTSQEQSQPTAPGEIATWHCHNDHLRSQVNSLGLSGRQSIELEATDAAEKQPAAAATDQHNRRKIVPLSRLKLWRDHVTK